MATRGSFKVKNGLSTYNLYRHWDNYPYGVVTSLFDSLLVLDEYQRPKTKGITEALCSQDAELIDFDAKKQVEEYYYEFSTNSKKDAYVTCINNSYSKGTKELFTGQFYNFLLWGLEEQIRNITTNEYYLKRPEESKEELEQINSQIVVIKEEINKRDKAKIDELNRLKAENERLKEESLKVVVLPFKQIKEEIKEEVEEVTYSNDLFAMRITPSDSSISDLKDVNMSRGYIRGKRDTKKVYKLLKAMSKEEREIKFKELNFWKFINFIGVSVHTWCGLD